MTHAELEDAGEGAGRWHPDHEALQNADPGVGLHHAYETHDLAALHEAVGIKRQHQRIVGAPPLAEVTHVAGLVAGIVGAAAIDETRAVFVGGLPGGEGLLLDHSDRNPN